MPRSYVYTIRVWGYWPPQLGVPQLYVYTIRVWGYGPPQLGVPRLYVYTIRVWGYEPPQLGTPRSYVYTINNERWGPFWGLPVHIAILQQVIIRNIYAKIIMTYKHGTNYYM